MSYELTPFARVALGVMIIGAAGTATYMLSIKQLDRPTVTQAVTSVVSPEPKAEEPSTEGKRNNKIETPSAPTKRTFGEHPLKTNESKSKTKFTNGVKNGN